MRMTVALRLPKASTPVSSSSTYLKDSLDVLSREGEQGQPKMMDVGLHGRLAGQPGRAQGVARFADYVLAQPGVWFARPSASPATGTRITRRPALLSRRNGNLRQKP
jgi:hypothetical protein